MISDRSGYATKRRCDWLRRVARNLLLLGSGIVAACANCDQAQEITAWVTQERDVDAQAILASIQSKLCDNPALLAYLIVAATLVEPQRARRGLQAAAVIAARSGFSEEEIRNLDSICSRALMHLLDSGVSEEAPAWKFLVGQITDVAGVDQYSEDELASVVRNRSLVTKMGWIAPRLTSYPKLVRSNARQLMRWFEEPIAAEITESIRDPESGSWRSIVEDLVRRIKLGVARALVRWDTDMTVESRRNLTTWLSANGQKATG